MVPVRLRVVVPNPVTKFLFSLCRRAGKEIHESPVSSDVFPTLYFWTDTFLFDVRQVFFKGHQRIVLHCDQLARR